MEINSAIVARALAGDWLTEAELAELDEVDVLSLGMLADEVRRVRVGMDVTYARVLEVSVSGPLPTEALASATASGCEVRLTGTGASLAATLDAVRAARSAVGATARLTGFSLDDLLAREWGTLSDVLDALKAAGLDALVEAPIDRVTPADVAAAHRAGLGPAVLSVRQPSSSRVDLLARVRACLAVSPAVAAFAPLAREQDVTTPTTGYHDVRLVALARIGLPGIPLVQADWQQYGPKLAQVALTFGANDLDRVSPTDDASLGRRRASVEEVCRNITAAGFTPRERGVRA